MPATRLTMRKIHEVLRLKFDCRLTKRQISDMLKDLMASLADGSLEQKLKLYSRSDILHGPSLHHHQHPGSQLENERIQKT
jgi:hypothetical protein